MYDEPLTIEATGDRGKPIIAGATGRTRVQSGVAAFAAEVSIIDGCNAVYPGTVCGHRRPPSRPAAAGYRGEGRLFGPVSAGRHPLPHRVHLSSSEQEFVAEMFGHDDADSALIQSCPVADSVR